MASKKHTSQGSSKAEPKAKTKIKIKKAAPYRHDCCMVETNGGGRVENVPGFVPGRALAEGFGGGRVPTRFRTGCQATAGQLEFAFPQSVCGHDDRTEVLNTSAVPWRCVCQLVMEGLHGTETLGTGWLAGPRTVFTAGHNLYSPRLQQDASTVWVMPGRSGDEVPFGFASSNAFAVHPKWRATGDPAFDFGVVWLDEPIGERLGWFGFAAHDDAQLAGLLVNNAGYPVDKPRGTQWFNAARIVEVRPDALLYGLDTEEGQSGSPVFFFDAAMNRTVVAVHAYGGCPQNIGMRITPEIFEVLQGWVR